MKDPDDYGPADWYAQGQMYGALFFIVVLLIFATVSWFNGGWSFAG